MVYDFKSLSRVLKQSGFKDIKKYNWKEFLPKNFDDYSKAYVTYMDETGLQMSLNIECKK